MNAMRQALWLLLVLLLLAGSGWYFASKPPVIKFDKKNLSTSVDAVVKNVTVRQFNIKGELSHYLQTPLIHHIPLNNTHELTTPHIMVTHEDQKPWVIDAKKAVALYGGKQITLINDVLIHQINHETAEETTVKTQELTYFPNEKRATTTKGITFSQPGAVVKSIGMNAYLAENRVQLLSHASGVYASNHG
jgi:lipopolysaccharide export system protein LptC